MSDLLDKLKISFKDKDYRHGYVDEFLNVSIATQIKVLREQRDWKQEDLAKYAQMKQPRISVMENVNYSSWSINTLRKLAETFDLTLRVSFVSFGERLKDIDRLNRKTLECPSFEDDPVFTEKREESIVATATAVEKANNDLARSNKEELTDTDQITRKFISIAAYQAARDKLKNQTEDTIPKRLRGQGALL
ncbi:MAG: helix-turn-helix transcriptional regulator [Mobilitalea sp.]